MQPNGHQPEALHCLGSGGAASAEALAGWVSARLAAHESALAALLAVEGPRTPENSLRLYDNAIEHLSLAGAQAGVLNSVAADKAVRDQAQMEAQRVAMAGSALSLNREVYEALAAINLDGASSGDQAFCGADAAGLPAGRRGQGPGDAGPVAGSAREGDAAFAGFQPQHSGGRQDDYRGSGRAGRAARGLPGAASRWTRTEA